MNTICLKANAKINLTLDVTGRRDDGYHLIESVMQSISLHDDVTITLRDDNEITITCDNNIPCDKTNIAWKAARLFLDHNKINQGVSIDIKKRIPSCAGLGGGSADGAAVLVGLNKLLNVNMSNDEVCKLGVQIGADIPFCIIGGAKLCTGIGELIEDAPNLKNYPIVLVKPELDISTKEAYGKIDGGLQYKKPNTKTLLEGLKYDNLDLICNSIGNIFSYTVVSNDVSNIEKELIANGAVCACMSGSGSAVYGIFNDEAAAEQCVCAMLRDYTHVYSAYPSHNGVELNNKD